MTGVPIDLGAKLPHTGAADPQAIPRRAQTLEAAGFDSLWVSDHIVMPVSIESHYPFAADGRATWPGDLPYVEALVAMTAAAAVTSRVRLGSAVLVLPQRNPVLLAKQLASLDALSGGRVTLGVGAGWLEEEFVALGASFDDRGARTAEWISILRDCWTGRTAAHDGAYHVPGGLAVLPTPVHPIPVLVGGHTTAALRRAGQHGDGWLAQQSTTAVDVDELVGQAEVVRSTASASGRDPSRVRITLRLVDSAGRAERVAELLARLADAAVDEVIVDVHAEDDPRRVHDLLREAA